MEPEQYCLLHMINYWLLGIDFQWPSYLGLSLTWWKRKMVLMLKIFQWMELAVFLKLEGLCIGWQPLLLILITESPSTSSGFLNFSNPTFPFYNKQSYNHKLLKLFFYFLFSPLLQLQYRKILPVQWYLSSISDSAVSKSISSFQTQFLEALQWMRAWDSL